MEGAVRVRQRTMSEATLKPSISSARDIRAVLILASLFCLFNVRFFAVKRFHYDMSHDIIIEGGFAEAQSNLIPRSSGIKFISNSSMVNSEGAW